MHGSSHRFQGAIPKDVREHFGGKKRYTLTFKTKDERAAERLAEEAEREFKSKVIQIRQAAMNGERIEPIRLQQITGYLFGQHFNRPQDDRYFDLEQSIRSAIIDAHEDGFPLLKRVPIEGAVFEELVRSVETLLEITEGTG